MFNSLQETLKKTFDRLSGRGRLSESDVLAASREIKLALLAADVHFGVVKDLVDRVAAKAVGKEVLESITPAQQFVKIVNDELTATLGKEAVPFDFSCAPPLVVMIVGLQGSGKTTTAARFALHCKKTGRRALLVPADVKRPAAIEQLKILAKEISVDCWPSDASSFAADVVKDALSHAGNIGHDTIIIDTAGRLHIDKEMMDEAALISKIAKPQRILYVADAMSGQDAVKSAKAFDELLPITGIVISKLDGDSRGGVALSVKSVTGKPIIFAGVGEKLTDLIPFHPERMASRILGMGDIVSLVEQASMNIGEDDAAEMGETFSKQRFTLDDFLKQLKMMKKMGPLDKLMGLLPNMGIKAGDLDPAELEHELKRKEAIVFSMTRAERSTPRILNGSRRKRIAAGAGVQVSDVNRFIKEFEAMEKMFKTLSKGGGMKGMFKQLNPTVKLG